MPGVYLVTVIPTGWYVLAGVGAKWDHGLVPRRKAPEGEDEIRRLLVLAA